MGYDCTEDCSGHDAGYQWAEDEGIDDADNCDRNSESFIEGCEVYVQENVEPEEEQGVAGDSLDEGGSE